MVTIGLVACGRAKLDHRAPARDLYISPLFRKASAYAAATYDRWLVLSAKHGLVDPDTELDPYFLDLRHAPASFYAAWCDRAMGQVRALGVEDDDFFILAGEKYAGPLSQHLAHTHEPLKGLGIGKQMAWFKERGF